MGGFGTGEQRELLEQGLRAAAQTLGPAGLVSQLDHLKGVSALLALIFSDGHGRCLSCFNQWFRSILVLVMPKARPRFHIDPVRARF